MCHRSAMLQAMLTPCLAMALHLHLHLLLQLPLLLQLQLLLPFGFPAPSSLYIHTTTAARCCCRSKTGDGNARPEQKPKATPHGHTAMGRWLSARYRNPEDQNREEQHSVKDQKSTGKRKRCTIEKCQAFASPSGSGFCSAHELKFTPVGARVADAAKYKCKTPACGNLPEGDIEFCPGAAPRNFTTTR